jgi:hypothetical protein
MSQQLGQKQIKFSQNTQEQAQRGQQLVELLSPYLLSDLGQEIAGYAIGPAVTVKMIHQSYYCKHSTLGLATPFRVTNISFQLIPPFAKGDFVPVLFSIFLHSLRREF